MNNLTVADNNILTNCTTSITASGLSTGDIYSGTIYYDSYSGTITSTNAWYPMAKLESDSNELKINIKKFQIKFNFNL